MEPGTESAQSRSPWYKDLRTRIALTAVLVVFVVLLSAGGWFMAYVMQPGPQVPVAAALVFIPRGSSVSEIERILAQARLIHEDYRFHILARVSGQAGKLQAGEFSLRTNQKPLAVIKELVSARPVEHLVTIKEGLNKNEIADIFATAGWVDRNRFLALTVDEGFLSEIGLAGLSSAEGYLFPDTYRLVKPPPGERELIRKLTDRFKNVWDTLPSDASELNRHEVVTLASIIEKETARGAERPVIASVFLNRLARKMRLQADPTAVYGLDDFDGSISRDDLQRETPYNTYIIPALPPGPISNPGKAALEAVLQPAETDYLYFVSKRDGSHYFSKSLKEHNRAVRKYLK